MARSLLCVAESWAAIRLFARSRWGRVCLGVAALGIVLLLIEHWCGNWVWLHIPVLRAWRMIEEQADGVWVCTHDTWLLPAGVVLLVVSVMASSVTLVITADRLARSSDEEKKGRP